MKTTGKAHIKNAPKTEPDAKYRVSRRRLDKSASPLMEDAAGAPAPVVLSPQALRRWVSESVLTTLLERPDILRSAVEEIWEDSPEAQAQFARCIEKGLSTPDVNRDEVFRYLEAKK